MPSMGFARSSLSSFSMSVVIPGGGLHATARSSRGRPLKTSANSLGSSNAAISETRPRNSETRIGSFYSGGVDSMYNIAEHRRLNQEFGVPLVSDLWLVQGAATLIR